MTSRTTAIHRRGSIGTIALIIGLVVAGFLTIPVHSVQAAATGYRGPSFSGASAPTAQKPQSKLWFNDGIWWGSLFSTETNTFTIQRFDWATNSWSNTGVEIDNRYQSSADCLWDGTYLYVA